MKTIAFLHGWGMPPAVFGEVAAELAAGFAVWAPDLPGYGAAPVVEPYTLEQLASQISLAAPERCQVVGWSLGGQVALCWARKKPQQVERLALIAATPCFVRRGDWPGGLDPEVLQTFSAALAHDAAATLDRFISLQAQCDRAARHVIGKLRALLASRPLPAMPVLESGLHILRDVDLRAVLGYVRQQTLVVHGEQDRLVSLDAATQLVNGLPHARLEVIPDAGHAPFVSNPAVVTRLLAEHFA